MLAGYGLAIELPGGWSGRVFSRAGGVATLHAASFALTLDDGEFGERSTASMRPGAVFLALTEYVPGSGLRAGSGLFAPRRIPRPLDPARFASSRLAHPRPGHAGMQHFFTSSGRPFCLYVVIARERSGRRGQLAVVDHALGSLRIKPRHPRGAPEV
jgi:hypothetical protein